MKKQRKFPGFTVTEILIVISVIGILAGIAIVVYPGYQLRTRNNERKSDVQQVAAALSAYALQKNNFVNSTSGCGKDGMGNGWLAGVTGGGGEMSSYPKAILTCMQEAGVLAGGSFIDPSGCLGASGGSCGVSGQFVRAYMKASCTKGVNNTVTYVLAYLESEPQKVIEVDALCDAGTVAGFTAATQNFGTRYGMNYYVTVR
jgi:type IV pilus assembly protein PilA